MRSILLFLCAIMPIPTYASWPHLPVIPSNIYAWAKDYGCTFGKGLVWGAGLSAGAYLVERYRPRTVHELFLEKTNREMITARVATIQQEEKLKQKENKRADLSQDLTFYQQLASSSDPALLKHKQVFADTLTQGLAEYTGSLVN